MYFLGASRGPNPNGTLVPEGRRGVGAIPLGGAVHVFFPHVKCVSPLETLHFHKGLRYWGGIFDRGEVGGWRGGGEVGGGVNPPPLDSV